jgi:hypothetical protein
MAALSHVQSLALADGWIGAGFIRDAVWDRLHGICPGVPANDVDVIWFDRAQTDPDVDKNLELGLLQGQPRLNWSVKNQARMHIGNGDAPYACVADAMLRWPETATAVAARLTQAGGLEINAPYGLDDLFALRLAPSPPFISQKRGIFEQRITQKRWLERYPLLVRA